MFNLFSKRLITKVNKFTIDDIEATPDRLDLRWLEKLRNLQFCFKQRNKIAVGSLVVAPCIMQHRPYLKEPNLFLDKLIAVDLAPRCVSHFMAEENKYVLVEIDGIDLDLFKKCDDYYHRLTVTGLRVYELTDKRFKQMRESAYLSPPRLFGN